MSERLPTILLYHQMEEDGRVGKIDEVERTSVSASCFREQIKTLLLEGWQFVPLHSVLAAFSQGPKWPKEHPIVALTFDDGYADILRVSPFLREHRIPATVFLLTESVGKQNLWNPKAYSIRNHLSLAEILQLIPQGFSFEFHGTDHHRLTKFSEEELAVRFARGQEFFEDNLGRRSSVIAYPFGSFDETVLAVAPRFFSYGLSVSQGRWGGAAQYQWNRVEITRDMDAAFLARLLSSPRKQRGALLREWRARH